MPTPTQLLDHLLTLAPDPKTLAAARRLFYSRRWQLLGGDGEWLWGEFSTKKKTRLIPANNDGTKPDYSRAIESAVGLREATFRCTCRARQRPCAHNLALLLLLKNDPDRLTIGQPPTWVRSVQFRAERPAKPTADLDAAGKRLEDRLRLMTGGVDDLELRLIDIARQGTADTLLRGPDFWLDAAARLTDAKLPGPAGQLRRLARLPLAADSPELLRTLGDLYLFVRAWKIRDELPPDRRQELYQFAGLTPKKSELSTGAGLNDHWLVLGVTFGQEDKLRWRRAWLRGERSRRYVLLLDYAFGEMPFEQSWPLGASFTGAVHYYPGSYPQRGVFPRPIPGGKPYDGLRGYTTVAGVLENYRRALGAGPWVRGYPVYLQEVRPIERGRGERGVVDRAGGFLPLSISDEGEIAQEVFYQLLAVSGGDYLLSVFGEFDGERFLPLSLVSGGGLVGV